MIWYMKNDEKVEEIAFFKGTAYFIGPDKLRRKQKMHKGGFYKANVLGVAEGFKLKQIKNLFPHAYIWRCDRLHNMPYSVWLAINSAKEDLVVTQVTREVSQEDILPININDIPIPHSHESKT